MLKLDEMKRLLKEALPRKRYEHSIHVYETALKLARAHDLPDAEIEKVGVSALLHDCGRQIPSRDSLDKAAELGIEVDEIEANQPILLHAKLGVYYARKKYKVEDADILDGIRYHTTGAANMSTLAMIVYLADLLEPTRDFPGIDDLRQLAKEDLEKSMMQAYGNTMRYLLDYKLLIHPNCLDGYNQLAIKFKKQQNNCGSR